MDHKEVDDSWKLMDCEEDHTTTKSFVLIDKDAGKINSNECCRAFFKSI